MVTAMGNPIKSGGPSKGLIEVGDGSFNYRQE